MILEATLKKSKRNIKKKYDFSSLSNRLCTCIFRPPLTTHNPLSIHASENDQNSIKYNRNIGSTCQHTRLVSQLNCKLERYVFEPVELPAYTCIKYSLVCHAYYKLSGEFQVRGQSVCQPLFSTLVSSRL